MLNDLFEIHTARAQQQQRETPQAQPQGIDAHTRHNEIKRRTPLYKWNITTKPAKKRFAKIALTEVVFVLEPDIATQYRRLRQEV